MCIRDRYIDGVSVVHWPIKRLLLSYGANVYARIVTGLPLKDSTGGFKAWKRKVLNAIDLGGVKSQGYSFQIEMNWRAWQKSFSIFEHPIIFADRTIGESKMSRKIARCLGKPYVLHRNSNSEWVEKIGEKINADREFMMECRDVVEFTSSLMDRHCIHFSKTYLAASMWFTSLMRCKAGKFPEFSQVLLCNTIGCSEVGLRNAMLKMLGILDMDIKQVKMLTVKEFTAGVRYG